MATEGSTSSGAAKWVLGAILALAFVGGVVWIVTLEEPPAADQGTAAATSENTDTGTAEAGPRTAYFRVEGMHCTGCSNLIKSKLVEVAGVESADVSFDESLATVTLAAGGPADDAIAGVITNAGDYTATVLPGRPDTPADSGADASDGETNKTDAESGSHVGESEGTSDTEG